jgi:hypothetical protein
MIDVPAPVYVEYKNLSHIVSQAESQKDLLASVIKKIEGQSKLILEYPQEDSSSKNFVSTPFYLEIRCLVCYPVTENNKGLILNSVKKITKTHGLNSIIYFDTYNFPEKISSWKIEVAQVKPILVHSGKNVKININIASGIRIQSMGKSLKNASQGDSVQVQVNNWFNNKNNSQHLNEVIEAKVIAPDEVEYVRK